MTSRDLRHCRTRFLCEQLDCRPGRVRVCVNESSAQLATYCTTYDVRSTEPRPRNLPANFHRPAARRGLRRVPNCPAARFRRSPNGPGRACQAAGKHSAIQPTTRSVTSTSPRQRHPWVAAHNGPRSSSGALAESCAHLTDKLLFRVARLTVLWRAAGAMRACRTPQTVRSAAHPGILPGIAH